MQALSKLYEELELGYFVVPEIQRGFVWRSSQVLELAASIYKKLPIGAICVCNMPRELVEEYKYLFKPLVDDYSIENGRYIVIDGRQRLTSLLLIKNGKARVENKDKRLDLYFNPRDARFQLARGRRRPDEDSFKVSDVLHADDVDEIVESRQLSDALRKTVKKELNKLRDVFRNYQVPIVNVETEWDKDDLIKVFERWSEMFVRLNSRGTRVKLPDLVLALITGKTVAGGVEPFRRRFHEIMEHLSKKGYDVDSPPLIRAYLAISTGMVKFKEASVKLDGMKPYEYLEYLIKTERAVVKVLDIMKELGVRLRYLQSNYLPVVPSMAIHNKYLATNKIIDAEFKKDLISWLVHASFDGRYTGRLESDLYEDISTLAQYSYEMKALMKNLRTQTILEKDLTGEYDDRHLTLLSVLYSHNRARDWNIWSGDPTMISNIPDDDLTVHHIFPDAVLKKMGYDEELRDDVANITLISKDANAAVKDKEPSTYLRVLRDADSSLLELHFIPLNESLWNPEKYIEFLSQRRKQIIEEYRRLFGIVSS